jgi:hypothetical protein
MFPYQLLDQWLAVPDHEVIAAKLTKQDINHLLFALLRGNEAQVALQRTLVSWSTGKTDEANAHLVEFQRLNVDSQNNVRQFFTGLMISFLATRPHGP